MNLTLLNKSVYIHLNCYAYVSSDLQPPLGNHTSENDMRILTLEEMNLVAGGSGSRTKKPKKTKCGCGSSSGKRGGGSSSRAACPPPPTTPA